MKIRFWIAGALALLMGVGSVYALRAVRQGAVAAAAVAKLSCSCVLVAGRPLDACLADNPPGLEQIPVTIDAKSKVAVASLFGIITRRATYSEAYGCTLEP